MEASFLHPNTKVDIFVEWSEGIVAIGITTKEFLEEYCMLLEKSMYGNVDTALLWLRLLNNYLVNKCNLKRSKSDHYIFFKKYDKGKLELIISVHLDDVFMAGKPGTLKNTKEKIKERFHISESKKVKKFLRVYY